MVAGEWHRRLVRRARPAFSLIELIVVIVLAAILSGLAIPALGSFSTTRAAAAARQIAADVGFARAKAISTGCRTWVVFAVPSNSYSILAEPIGSPGRANAAGIADPATGRSFIQEFNGGDFAGVTLLNATFDSGTELGFDWRGQPLNGSSSALAALGQVSLSGGTTISVHPGTGLATVP